MQLLLKFYELYSLPGSGRQFDGVNFKQQMRLLLLWSFVVSFRKTALNFDFILILYGIFNDFIQRRGGYNFMQGVGGKFPKNCFGRGIFFL